MRSLFSKFFLRQIKPAIEKDAVFAHMKTSGTAHGKYIRG
jgi:hypothetical protein